MLDQVRATQITLIYIELLMSLTGLFFYSIEIFNSSFEFKQIIKFKVELRNQVLIFLNK